MDCSNYDTGDLANMDNRKPKIDVLSDEDYLYAAHWVTFGIEEEGIPFAVQKSCENIETEALKWMDISIPGVTITVTGRGIDIYYKYFRDRKAFLHYPEISRENAKKAGKNAAKIVKNKPLIV